jgi:hypothetical protein
VAPVLGSGEAEDNPEFRYGSASKNETKPDVESAKR